MKNKIYINPENEEFGDFFEIGNGLISWNTFRTCDSDLGYISSNFIKSFLDIDCYNNKAVWEDDVYLEDNYPIQYLLKKILSL